MANNTTSNLTRFNRIVDNLNVYEYGSIYGPQRELVDYSSYREMRDLCFDLMQQVAEKEGTAIRWKDKYETDEAWINQGR